MSIKTAARVRVRFVETFATPTTCYRAGYEYELDEETAEQLAGLYEVVKQEAKKERK